MRTKNWSPTSWFQWHFVCVDIRLSKPPANFRKTDARPIELWMKNRLFCAPLMTSKLRNPETIHPQSGRMTFNWENKHINHTVHCRTCGLCVDFRWKLLKFGMVWGWIFSSHPWTSCCALSWASGAQHWLCLQPELDYSGHACLMLKHPYALNYATNLRSHIEQKDLKRGSWAQCTSKAPITGKQGKFVFLTVDAECAF